VLSTTLDPVIAAGALILPSSLYTILKMFVIKPYNLRRKRRKSLEQRRLTAAQVLDARASSAKAQLLLKNVAERKKQKQAQRQGLVILEASYGDIRAQEQGVDSINNSGLRPEDDDSDLPPPYLDVTIPLQFLVDDSGQLQVWFPIPSPLVFPLLLNAPIHLP
jgi:DnaJ family protein C protein 11